MSLHDTFEGMDGALKHDIYVSLQNPWLIEMFRREIAACSEQMANLMQPEDETHAELLKFKRQYQQLRNRKDAYMEVIELAAEADKLFNNQK